MVGRDGYMVMACWMGKDGGIDRFIFYASTLTMPDIRQILTAPIMTEDPINQTVNRSLLQVQPVDFFLFAFPYGLWIRQYFFSS